MIDTIRDIRLKKPKNFPDIRPELTKDRKIC